MTSPGEFVPTTPDEQLSVPIVRGEPINVPFDVESGDSSLGVPNDIAERVSQQVLQALSRFGLAPEQVVFSGYSSPDDPEHVQKTEGTFGYGDLDAGRPDNFLAELDESAYFGPEEAEQMLMHEAAEARARQQRPEGTCVYFYGRYEDLTDGEEGPLAHAAMGETPALGVYDYAKLSQLDADDGQVTATPQALRQTMVFEFRPTYVFRDPV
jgi:hypothetical protein